METKDFEYAIIDPINPKFVPEPLVAEDFQKFNPNHDELGRFATSSGMSGSTAESIISRTQANGGLSVRMISGREPRGGYMVATSNAYGQIVEASDFYDRKKGIKILADYAKANKSRLVDGKYYLGLWHNEGQVYLDVSEHVMDRTKAINEGRVRNQKSIWDVANFAEIDTGGSGVDVQKHRSDSDSRGYFDDDGRADRRVGGEGIRRVGQTRVIKFAVGLIPVLKYNPNHDPSNGQFTTSGGGAPDASVSRTAPGFYEYQYGDFEYADQYDINSPDMQNGAYGHWAGWDGNHEMRLASASFMGLDIPPTEGEGFSQDWITSTLATGQLGSSLDLSANPTVATMANVREFGTRLALTHSLLNAVTYAESAPELYRGIAVNPAMVESFKQSVGKEVSMPLSAFTSDMRLATDFTKPTRFQSGMDKVTSPVIFVLEKGSKSFDSANTSDEEGDYKPTEFVTQGKFKVTGVEQWKSALRVKIKQTDVFNVESGGYDKVR